MCRNFILNKGVVMLFPNINIVKYINSIDSIIDRSVEIRTVDSL